MARNTAAVTKSTGTFAAKRTISRVTGFDFAPAVTGKEWGVKMVSSQEAQSSSKGAATKPAKRAK